MDPTQICTGDGTLCPWGEGSWPFCFGPEKTKKLEESGLKNFCIPIFFKEVQGNPIKYKQNCKQNCTRKKQKVRLLKENLHGGQEWLVFLLSRL